MDQGEIKERKEERTNGLRLWRALDERSQEAGGIDEEQRSALSPLAGGLGLRLVRRLPPAKGAARRPETLCSIDRAARRRLLALSVVLTTRFAGRSPMIEYWSPGGVLMPYDDLIQTAGSPTASYPP
jgi:hypothetical protein